jgi:penicillin V acylase-like amidase (Ntn superfamily)
MCTRIFNNFNKENNFLTTARNMDWATELPTCLFVFRNENNNPMEKTGTNPQDENSLIWTAKYDSIITMVGDEQKYGASDGLNSAGLAANLLYDSNASYKRKDGSTYKNLDVFCWLQFVLDTCCSVQEVIAKFSKEASPQIQIIGGIVPGSTQSASLHLSVSDAFGDSAIIEVNAGEYIIYNDRKFRVMTNEPSYEKQIELNQYWRWQWSKENNFPSNTLPGGTFPSDRFARASYYLNHLDEPVNIDDSLAQSKSVVMNASVPVNFKSGDSNHPNIAQTLWTTISSHNDLKYFFCNSRTPGSIWIDLNKIDLFPAPVSRLILVEEVDSTFINKSIYGFKNNDFEVAKDPFEAK